MKSDIYTLEEKQQLLKLARTTIEESLNRAETSNILKNPKFDEILSCFVTLHTGSNQLRGCIGSIIGYEPLIENIIGNAKNAAFNDPRFPAVSSIEELNTLRIEISILTKPETAESYNDIVLGQHGIILRKDGHSAVFLPQVAPEQGWDLETTLTYLAQKAGLFPADWKEPDAQFDLFEAVVFSE